MVLVKTLVLVGMMGSGKTSVGKVLSKLLNVPFIDTDNEISKDANRTISEIFERDGERVFRQAEARTIKRLLQGPPCVVSSGGGAFMSKENRDIISKFGVSILLKVDPEILWGSFGGTSTPETSRHYRPNRPNRCCGCPAQAATEKVPGKDREEKREEKDDDEEESEQEKEEEGR